MKALNDKKSASGKYLDMSCKENEPVIFVHNEIKHSLNITYLIEDVQFTAYRIPKPDTVKLAVQRCYESTLRSITESILLSRYKHFSQKLLGKISIQSFVDRSTRQSYKLLPEF